MSYETLVNILSALCVEEYRDVLWSYAEEVNLCRQIRGIVFKQKSVLFEKYTVWAAESRWRDLMVMS